MESIRVNTEKCLHAVNKGVEGLLPKNHSLDAPGRALRIQDVAIAALSIVGVTLLAVVVLDSTVALLILPAVALFTLSAWGSPRLFSGPSYSRGSWGSFLGGTGYNRGGWGWHRQPQSSSWLGGYGRGVSDAQYGRNGGGGWSDWMRVDGTGRQQPGLDRRRGVGVGRR